MRSINNNFLNGKNIEEDIKKQNEVIYPSNPKHNKFEMDYFTHVDDLDTSKMDKLPVLQKTNICKPSFLGESISIANIKNKNKVYNLQQLAADANPEELDKLIAQQIQSSSPKKKSDISISSDLINLKKGDLEKSNKIAENKLIHQSKLKRISNSFRDFDGFVSNNYEILYIIEFTSESITSLKLD